MPSSTTRLAMAWASTLLIVALCLWPRSLMPARESGPRVIPHTDKVIHFGMFALFGALWTRASTARPASRRRLVLIVAAGWLLAGLTEAGQALSWVDRDPDILDALADGLGALAGVALLTPRDTAPS